MPRVLQRDGPGRLPRRHHLIPSRHNRATFTLNTLTGHFPWTSTPQWYVLLTPLTGYDDKDPNH